MNVWYGSRVWNEEGGKTKKNKKKTKLYFNQADEKGSLVPQVQEVLLELRM